MSRGPDFLTDDQREHLCRGGCLIGGPSIAFESEADAKAAWERHKADIMALQGQQVPYWNKGCVYFKYGQRPAYWWRYDAPEQRQVIGKFIRPYFVAIHNGKHVYNHSKPPTVSNIVESQVVCLKRTSQLMPGEYDKYIEQEISRIEECENRKRWLSDTKETFNAD